MNTIPENIHWHEDMPPAVYSDDDGLTYAITFFAKPDHLPETTITLRGIPAGHLHHLLGRLNTLIPAGYATELQIATHPQEDES